MATVIATPVGALILAGIGYGTARLTPSDEPCCPPFARLRGRRAALEAAEQWLMGLRLYHRIDAATYQQRISDIARGRRRTATRPSTRVGGRHG